MNNALVFDLDGTLIDSIPDVSVAVNRTLACFDKPEVSLEALREMVGDGARAMLENAFAAQSMSPKAEIIDAALPCYLRFYKDQPAEKTTIYEGVWQVLDYYADTGTVMGICTNKPGVMTDIVLEELGLAKYFAAVTAGDNVPHRKPDGRHIHLTLERMGIPNSSAIMIGDSATDLLAARDAKIPSIAVTYGYAHGSDELCIADVLIDTFADLPKAVAGLTEKFE